jgi:hypothetical protein
MAGANSVVRTGVGSGRCPNSRSLVPHPLRDHLPALLSPGGVAAPAIRVEFLIFIGERRLKGATMQIEFDDIGSGEGRLWQGAEKEFVDHARTGDAHRTLLLAGRMGRYHHPAPLPICSHRHLRAVVEAAHGLALLSAVGTDQVGGADVPLPSG